jgi:hypothetical protein
MVPYGNHKPEECYWVVFFFKIEQLYQSALSKQSKKS